MTNSSVVGFKVDDCSAKVLLEWPVNGDSSLVIGVIVVIDFVVWNDPVFCVSADGATTRKALVVNGELLDMELTVIEFVSVFAVALEDLDWDDE